MGQGADMQGATQGTLLGGRVAYRQLAAGHRSGFEPVLLAACVPAAAGERVLEAGTGAGAALLCLAARVQGVFGVGVEREAGLCALAAENFAANGFGGVFAVRGDVTALPFARQSFDHVMANPPWFAPGAGSPDRLRAVAREAGPGVLEGWVESLAAVVRPRGTMTLIVPAAGFAAAAAALRGRFGGIMLCPLWRRAGEGAKMVILQGRKGARSADRVVAGLVLHDGGEISEAAQRVLRDGEGFLGSGVGWGEVSNIGRERMGSFGGAVDNSGRSSLVSSTIDAPCRPIRK